MKYHRTRIGKGSSHQGLSCSRRSTEEDATWRHHMEGLEEFRVQQREENHLLEGLDVLIQTT